MIWGLSSFSNGGSQVSKTEHLGKVVVRIACVAGWIGLIGAGSSLAAQPPGDVSDGAVPIAIAQTNVAIAGVPFGVAILELPLATAVLPERLPALEVSDEEGRIFYPVVHDVLAEAKVALRREEPDAGEPRIGGGRLLRRVGDLVRQATTPDETPLVVSREATFLFRGDGPLRVKTNVPDGAGRTEFLLTPASPVQAIDLSVALNRWWGTYTRSMLRQSDAGDYPPIVENYLLAYLSGRMNLPLPPEYVVDASDDDPTLVSTLGLIAGTDKIRSAIFRRSAIGAATPVMEADLPLPNEPLWSPAASPIPAALPPIEPLASRVPPECFYIRYGSFENYLWFRDLSEEYGGDIGRMVALRGSDNGAARRVEEQLHVKTTELSRMLGGTVIEDQAIIGRDLFLSEGASLGVVFRAKNAFLLQTSMNSDRSALAQSDAEVKLSNEKIAGREVSFLHTADNRIRSYMVVDGEYIFITNSRTLAERFIKVGQSGESLAATADFILARQLMPLSRGDTVFAYFSPEMLRGLVAPEYLIEMRRRLYSTADIALVRLARLASAAEGQPSLGPEDLIDSGFLPREFGQRSDGSGVLAIGDEIVDSLRGKPGTLLPIADVEIDRVTMEERDWYGRVATFHETKWQQLDPIFFGVTRRQISDSPSIQRLEIHGEIAPLVPEKYGTVARQLGPPTRVKIDFAPDDIVAAQAHVVSDQLEGSIPPHHLFAAIKDTTPPPPDQFDGFLKTYQALQSLPGYLGAWPQPGLLDRLPLGLGRGQVVGPGLTRLIGGVYRYQGGGFSVVSLQSDVLLASLPFLAANEADDLAQVRLRVGNLRGSQLEEWVNVQIHDRNRATSRAGAAFLGLLSSQLKVSPEHVNKMAGELLGGDLQDPLGGRYRLVNVGDDSNRQTWVSDAWETMSPTRQPDSPEPTSKYVAPVLSWFRGGRADLTQYPDRLVVNAVIDVERAAVAPFPNREPGQASSNESTYKP